MKILTANNYFDFEDQEKPVKAYLDDRLSFRLGTDNFISYRAYIQRNEYTLHDGFFQLTEGTPLLLVLGDKGQFYSVETLSNSWRTQDSVDMLHVELYQDPKYYKYERKVLSFSMVGRNLTFRCSVS